MSKKHKNGRSFYSITIPTSLKVNWDIMSKFIEDEFNIVLKVEDDTLYLSGRNKKLMKEVGNVIIELSLSGVTYKSVEELAAIWGDYLSARHIITYDKAGRPITPLSENQKHFIKAVQENDITFVIGPAGTGKTYLAVAQAVGMLRSRQINKIVITRPLVEVNEKLGFLPGDIKNKVMPFLIPIYDVLGELFTKSELENLEKNGVIEIIPIAFMRGRTIKNSIVIADEAQNLTISQMKMLLTRIGLGTKYIIIGDVTQSDIHNGKKNGLLYVVERIKRAGSRGFGIVKMTDVDIRRHPIITEVLKLFDNSV